LPARVAGDGSQLVWTSSEFTSEYPLMVVTNPLGGGGGGGGAGGGGGGGMDSG
jgi:hypothetical protein